LSNEISLTDRNRLRWRIIIIIIITIIKSCIKAEVCSLDYELVDT